MSYWQAIGHVSQVRRLVALRLSSDRSREMVCRSPGRGRKNGSGSRQRLKSET
jgi:hypothetical protein